MDANTLFQETVVRLQKHEGQYAEIARLSGLSYSQLTKVAQGHADNPTVGTLQKVIEALNAFEARLEQAAPDPDADRISPVETA